MALPRAVNTMRTSWYRPAGHATHAALEVAPRVEENRPAPHAMQVSAVLAPTTPLYRPAAHAMHRSADCAPLVTWKRPAGQAVHVEGELAPTTELYRSPLRKQGEEGGEERHP